MDVPLPADVKAVSRIALVTPWSWSVPHPVNDHVRELAGAIAAAHAADPSAPDVVVVAASSNVVARRETRRALRELAQGGEPGDVLHRPALSTDCAGHDVPLLALGLPLGRAGVSLRANLTLALRLGGIDLLVVHDPLVSDLSRVATRRFTGITVGCFHELPPRSALQALGTTARERLAEAIDVVTVARADQRDGLAALLGVEASAITVLPDGPVRAGEATGGHDADAGPGADDVDAAPAAAAGRAGAGPDRRMRARARAKVRPGERRRGSVAPQAGVRSVVLGRGRGDEALLARVLRDLRGVLEGDPQLEVVSASRWEPAHRPTAPRWLRGRLRSVQPGSRAVADELLAGAVAFVAFPGTPARAIEEARAAGVPVLHAGGDRFLPASLGELLDAGATPTPAADFPSPADLVAGLLDVAADALRHRRPFEAPTLPGPGARTHRIDMHMHTNHSYDCATDPEALMFAARKAGLSAICVTDHNEVSGALACAEVADEYGVEVIVGEEVMTTEGEVIGLFLTERIPPQLSWNETLARIHAQDGLVYVPHPFDRMHTIPDVQTLRATLDEIDVLETCNGRLAFEQYNRDAERFARKYNLVEGAGSDAHVVPGLASATVALPAWDGPESLLTALRQGVIERRPSSYLYVQTLKRIDHIAGRVGAGAPADVADEA